MVVSDYAPSGEDARFTIRPTRSLSPRGMLFFFTLVCIVTLTINIGFVIIGAWLVLPFAGFELAALGGGLWYFLRFSNQAEFITIKADNVHVLRIDHKKVKQEWSYQRYWARVVLSRDVSTWYPSKLIIRSHGRSVEIGSFLTDIEREQLATDLKKILNKPVVNDS